MLAAAGPAALTAAGSSPATRAVDPQPSSTSCLTVPPASSVNSQRIAPVTGVQTPVRARVSEASFTIVWYGRFNREDQTLPVRNLGRNAARLGLVRTSQGMLLLTSAARRPVADPPQLWRHLARRWLSSRRSAFGRDAVLFLAVEVAVGAHTAGPELMESVAYGLEALGWVNPVDDGSLSDQQVREAIRPDLLLLADLGAIRDPLSDREPLAQGGPEFARAALQTAPSRLTS